MTKFGKKKSSTASNTWRHFYFKQVTALVQDM